MAKAKAKTTKKETAKTKKATKAETQTKSKIKKTKTKTAKTDVKKTPKKVEKETTKTTAKEKKSDKKTEQTSLRDNPKIKNLINKGRSKGFITYDELLRVIPEAEENIELLDELYSIFIEEKIDVMEDLSAVDSVKDLDLSALEKELKETTLETTLARDVTADPVRMYLREIGRENLLTAEQEVELAQMVEAHDYELAVEKLKKEGAKKPRIEKVASVMIENYEGKKAQIKRAQEAKEQYERFKEEGRLFKMRKARQKLINANLRLVVSIAKRYMNRGLTFSDLIQEGNIGLMRAVDKFDWRRGFKFSTYATWWIRQAITRAIADQARTIRIPVHMIETINKLKRVQRELEQKYEREPTAEEIAKVMKIEPEKVEEILKISQEPNSLQTKIGPEGDTELSEFIQDPNLVDPEDFASDELLKGHIEEILDTLNERERKVLELRFGLVDNKPRTLEEVGKVFGVTRERIRQIEAKALRKLRHPSRSRKLKDYLA